MDRRAALARLAALMGATAVGAEFFLEGCRRPDKATVAVFSPGDLALMDEIGETIVPATDTPGAKSVGIGAFMAMMVNDCYTDGVQAVFQKGLVSVDAASNARFHASFIACTPEQRTAVLNDLDKEQRIYSQSKPASAPAHYFRLMKELALLGYFSSETGCTKALRYVESPGAYHGDVPYTKGDRAWFNPSHRSS